MKRKLSAALLMILLCQTLLATAVPMADAATPNLMTKYRVYQNDKALKEFTTEAQAITYAKNFGYSHVETISGRSWVWDNLPKYKVYQNGKSDSKLEFQSYDLALAAAKKLTDVHIRDLETIGWKYASYAKFQLYQGDKTKASWSFLTLDAAKKEAKKWGNAHIIDLNTNKWVWGNLTSAQITAQRAAAPVYQIVVDGLPVQEDKLHAFLFDAINAAATIDKSEVINTATGLVVHSNMPVYTVQQYGILLKEFISLDAALQLAKKTTNGEIMYKGTVLWSGVPYLSVYQGDKKLRSFNSKQSAFSFAKGYANSVVRTADGAAIWSNASNFVYLGWNGSSNSSTVLSHVANTQGLSIDSPTWYELTAADGTLSDKSNSAIVATLKEQGIQTMPLVHNQFNRKMTTDFLKNNQAQQAFISKLVASLVNIGAAGVNLDFEELAGADRTAYTSFVTALAKEVHAKGLKLSIDLPRGSLSWNHLTAYDHAALANVVDTIVIMAYDEHWKGSETPGSVAGLKWTEEGVKQFLSYGIPRNKLILGIPFYVREWQLDSTGKLVGNRAIFMKEIPQLITDTKAVGVYDEASGQIKYKYVKDGFTYLFWAETEETVKARINMAKAYDLAGIGAWRLGYESSDLWTMMLRMK